MSGQYRVIMWRIGRQCPVCGAAQMPWTHPFAGTVIDTTCRVEKCVAARMRALAGASRRGGELLPLDDRDRIRRPLWAQASGGVA